jgi:hypothetical protein
MADTFSFEEAQKRSEPVTFSFEEASKAPEPVTFSFEEASKPAVEIPGAGIVRGAVDALAEPVKGLFGQGKYQDRNIPLAGSVMEGAPETTGAIPQDQAQAAYERVTAANAAKQQVQAEQRAKIMAESKAEYGFKPEDNVLEDVGTTLKRSLAKGYYGLVQAGGGQARFLQDMLGIDSEDTAIRLDETAARTEGMGAAINKPVEYVEGAISSITQQLPALVGGALTGSEPLVLGSMFLNSFGQSYDDSRREGLDVGDSTARGALYGTLEVIGEKLGLGDTLKGIKAAAKGVPTKELVGHFAKALAKEIPGEELTYAGQFAVDKGYDLNPEAGIREFLQGAVDTMAVTVLQGGMMMGAGAGVNKAIRSLDKMERETRGEDLATVAEAEVAQKTKAALEAEPEQFKTPAQQMAELAPTVEETTAVAEGEAPTAATPQEQMYNDAVIRYRQLGFNETMAATQAAAEVKEAEDAGEFGEPVAGTSEPSIQEPSLEGTTAEGVAAPTGEGLGGAPVQAEGTDVGQGAELGALETPAAPVAEEAPVEVTPQEDRAIQLYQMKTNQIIGVLQSAAEGNTIAQQEFAETGKSPTDKKVRKYLMDYFTPLLGRKDAKRYTDYLVEEGGLDAGDYGMGHELFDMALSKIPVMGATTATPEAAPAEAAPVVEAPVVTKGKRGRPAKTAEEKAATAELAAQRKAERKASGRTKLLNDTRYKLNNALTYLQTPDVDASVFPNTPEGRNALQSARNELSAKQVNGAKDIYRIATNPELKGTPNQKKAAELVAKWTLQEKKAIEAMVREEEIGPNRAEIGAATESGLAESTNGREDGSYLTDNNAVQALSRIRKMGNEFEKALAQRIAPFLQGTKLVIVHNTSDLPRNVRAKFKGAVGMYDNVTRTIYLSAEGGLNNTVFLHEAVHGATIARINQYIVARNQGKALPRDIEFAMQELQSLMQRTKNFYTVMKGADTLTPEVKRIVDNMDEFLKVEAFDDVKEFVAYGFTHPAFQEFLYILPGRIAGKDITKTNGFSRFVDSVRRILGMDAKHDSALQDLIAITDTVIGAPSFKGPDVSGIDESLPAKARVKKQKLDRDQEKVQASVQAADGGGVLKALGKIARDGHKPEDYKALFNAVYEGGTINAFRKMLKSMQTMDILRWKGDDIAGLHDIDKIQQQMAALHEHLNVGATKKAEALGEFVRKNGQRVIGEAMHLARLKKFSPQIGVKLQDALKNDAIVQHYDKLLASETDPKKITSYKRLRNTRANDIDKVYKAWDALGKQKNGQEMYVMVRDFYRDNFNATRRILNEQLEKLPIEAEKKAKLLKSVRLMYEQGKTADTDEFIDETGVAIKVPRAAEDYFPFRRYGDYWLNIKGPKGREFYLFESAVERNLFQAARAKELGLTVDDSNIQRGDGASDLRRRIQDGSMMLQKMFADIEDMKPTKAELAKDPDAFDAYKDQLKDQLYQTYLMTLPERSFRKQFLHAEEVTGFSADIFRNFKTTANTYANQLAKLKYGIEIEEQIQRANEYLEGAPPAEAERDRVVIKEIAQRARQEINPTPVSKAVTIANQFAYYWLLTSGASAATQFLSMPMVVMPTLTGRYGAAKSTALLTKYMAMWNSIGTKETLPGGEKTTNISFGTSKMVKNNPLLKAAFDAAVDRHVTTITNTSVLTDLGATPERVSESNLGLAGRSPVIALRAMGSLFSGAERLTREMTYLMAFEAEYAKNGKNFDDAVDKAINLTYDTLGRYDSFNRATIMRNAVGRTVGQFKQYAYTMSSFFVRNLYNSLRVKGVSAEERRAAITTMTGTLAMGWLFAGIGGFPAFSSFCFLIDMLLDAFGDDEEKKKRRAENPFFAGDFKSRFMYEWLPEKLGQITVPGVDGRDHKLSDVVARGPVSVLSDIDFGSRVGWDNMWFRGGNVQPTLVGTLGSYTEELLGPAYSGAKTILQGAEDLYKGDFLRGIEGIAPAALRTPVAATRMALEGAETRKGEDILRPDELNAMNIVAKAIGYSPTRLTELQQYRFAINQQIQAAKAKHNELLGALNKAAFDEEGSPDKVKRALADIDKFNQRYPGVKGIDIDLDTMDRSMNTYADRKGMTYRGIYLDENLLPYIEKSLQGVNPLK